MYGRWWGETGHSIPRGGQHKSNETKTHPYLAGLLSPLTAECTEGGGGGEGRTVMNWIICESNVWLLKAQNSGAGGYFE